MQKTIAIILTAVMLLAVFVACSDGGEPSDTSTSAVTEAGTGTEDLRAQVKDDLPDKKYGDGEEFIIFIREDQKDTFFMEEQNGELVDEAIYFRNLNVSERFDIDIKVQTTPGGWDDNATYLKELRTQITAGSQDIDLIEGYAAYIGTFAGEKLFGNWLSMDYNNLTKPWWSEKFSNEFTINDTLYFLCGDLSLSLWANMYTMLFNKTVAENYNIPDLYQLAENRVWTLDKLTEVIKNVTLDNGDTVWDDQDLYGLFFCSGNNIDAIQTMFGCSITVKDSDGIPELNIKDVVFTDLYEKLYKLSYENQSVMPIQETAETFEIGRRMFTNDQLLILPYLLGSVETLRGMDTDFGILPYPMFNEAQGEYISTSSDSFAIFCYPNNVENPEKTSIITEALCAESYKTVIPKYYEISLKTKNTRDDQSEKMIDIIRDNLTFNFGAINSSALGNPAQLLRIALRERKSDVASSIESNFSSIERNFQKLIAVYQ